MNNNNLITKRKRMKTLKTILITSFVAAAVVPALANKAQDLKLSIENGTAMPSGFSRVAGDSCDDPLDLTCGDNLASISGSTDIYYQFNLTLESAVSVDLSFMNLDGDLDLLLWDDDCVSPTLIGSSDSITDNELIYADCLAPGRYTVQIDTQYSSPDAVPFMLSLNCNDCVVVPVPCEPIADAIPINCGDVVNGTNDIPCDSSIDSYSCIGWTETGPEVFYQLLLLEPTTLDIVISNMSADLDIFLLPQSGSPDDCIEFGDSGISVDCLPAGLYYIAVDGYFGAISDFTLSLTCNSCQVAEAVDGPVAFDLKQNYPNPFNPTTTIEFSIENTELVNLSVYSISGEKVATLVDGITNAGNNSVTFDASNLSSGVYFYTLNANGVSATSKMILMK
jgi:hypothetical protein